MTLFGILYLLVSLLAVTHAFISTQRLSCVNQSPLLLKYSADKHENENAEISVAHVDSSDTVRPEFAVLSPGSQIQLQIGNLDLARKAWKKRRRSGSPMLIPCSILNTDRKSMITNNLVFLLRKFGQPLADQDMTEWPDGFKSHHIAISLPELSRWYKAHLRASLTHHSNVLGYETAADLIRDVMSPQVEKDLGIKLWTVGTHSWVVARISKMRGQRLAAQSPLLQFIQGDDDTMMHTGKTRIKTDVAPGSYSLEPMSAALRVSQRAIDTGAVSSGSIHQGSFVGVDQMGDGGAPLLKVSLNAPTESQVRKRSQPVAPRVGGKPLELNLHQLKHGQGPFKGEVVYISGRSGAAFIDIGAGRPIKNQANDGTGLTRVLGMLRFDDLVRDVSSSAEAFLEEANDEVDCVEEALNAMHYDIDDDDEEVHDAVDMDGDILSDFTADDLFDDDDDEEEEDDDDGEEEFVEDISHLLTLEGGKYTFRDPVSGEVVDLGDDDDDDDDDDDQLLGGGEGGDIFAGLTPSQRFERLGDIMDDNDGNTSEGTTTLEIGDSINVFIQTVSKQSGRFMVTTRSSGPSMKVLKQATKSNKNLERLLAIFDGDIDNILTLVGDEGEGIVKAISKTGDWLYVQPQFRGLPVGVAQLASGITRELLAEGDSVHIRLDGVDEARGQLALTVMKKN
jgi:hypothetical protein